MCDDGGKKDGGSWIWVPEANAVRPTKRRRRLM